MIRIPKKRLPKFFSCPICGKEAVRVEIFRNEEKAIVSCGNCGAREEFPIKHALGEIDVYCMFTDKIYGGIKASSASEVKTSK